MTIQKITQADFFLNFWKVFFSQWRSIKINLIKNKPRLLTILYYWIFYKNNTKSFGNASKSYKNVIQESSRLTLSLIRRLPFVSEYQRVIWKSFKYHWFASYLNKNFIIIIIVSFSKGSFIFLKLSSTNQLSRIYFRRVTITPISWNAFEGDPWSFFSFLICLFTKRFYSKIVLQSQIYCFLFIK